MDQVSHEKDSISFQAFRAEVLEDYRVAMLSRQCSLIGRKEVLTGKAKFGIFGDGKEVAQVAMAKNFRDGDWRSGYYRDQTFMFASGMSGPVEFFAQLYGDTDLQMNPGNSGRSFNNHYSTPNVNPDGSWRDLSRQKNSGADLSPTAAQMPKLVGLAYASRLFRQNKDLSAYRNFSENGNEVAFGTIGEGSTSEGHFFEVMNAAGVLQIPLAMAVWDDGYAISVSKDKQTIKSSISEALAGFRKDADSNGILIYRGRGWDYPGLCKIFEKGIRITREQHIPVLFHVDEMTQPMGHSSSGSHERYKSRQRLDWEREFDPVRKMREWMIESGIADEKTILETENLAEKQAREARDKAWSNYQDTIRKERAQLLEILKDKTCRCKTDRIDKVSLLTRNLRQVMNPIRKDNISAAKKILRHICHDCPQREILMQGLNVWIEDSYEAGWDLYSRHLYNEKPSSVLRVQSIPPFYSEGSPESTGREVLRDNFDRLFEKYPLLVTFGEDSGKIGGVNQSLEGLQQKYGELRIFDTGIRETTIIGKGIGMAMRGLRPIAEIQYFDYLLYGLQTLSDDLASLHYRTKGMQSAPLIIRTRGHRLEGIWHSGSPLSMVINSIRGIYVCVPRDMTRAAGFYNTLLEGDDPALVIEPLNGYRLKELRPDNIGEYRIPLGIPEVLNRGRDITIVTYGSCVRIARETVSQLREFNIEVDLIDVQTLLPFDLPHTILESVRKTGRILFFDEDVPGGATAYMMQKVLEEQGAFKYLNAEPRSLTGRDHRPAYGTDGDYFSNPSAEDVFEVVYQMMHQANPAKYPSLY